MTNDSAVLAEFSFPGIAMQRILKPDRLVSNLKPSQRVIPEPFFLSLPTLFTLNEISRFACSTLLTRDHGSR